MTIKITDETFQGFIESGVTLVDLWAPWCKPCLALSPIVEELSTEYENVKVGKIDADENPETLKRLGVRNIPTILIYKNGSIVEKHVGMASKAQLKELIDKHLN